MPSVIPENNEVCPARLSAEHLERFYREGYLAFEGVLNKTEVQEASSALRTLTERLVTGSGVEYTPPGAGRGDAARFRIAGGRCFTQLEAGYDPTGRSLDEIEMNIRKYWQFTSESEAIRRIISPGSMIRRIVEDLVGTDPILFQEMALVKPPFIGAEKPWHQDDAYFSIAPLTAVLGVWIALDDARVENGCMHVLPGGQHLGALRHVHRDDCEIEPGRLDTSGARPVPVSAGGALFFSGLLPHETPPNRSPFRRRALQFHFRSANSQVVDQESYNAIFVEADGNPASCKAARRL